MNEHGINEQNLLAALPLVIAEDERLNSLATAIARALIAHLDELDVALVYSRIDELPEALLDILAVDFAVDWWDGNWSLTQKRESLKASWRIHRILGTPYAVNMAVRAVFGEGEVREWFDYGGKPHHFRVSVLNDGTFRDIGDWDKFIRLLELCRRLSSWLDEIDIVTDIGESELRCGGVMGRTTRMIVPEMTDKFDLTETLRTGGLMAISVHIPLRGL